MSPTVTVTVTVSDQQGNTVQASATSQITSGYGANPYGQTPYGD